MSKERLPTGWVVGSQAFSAIPPAFSGGSDTSLPPPVAIQAGRAPRVPKASSFEAKRKSGGGGGGLLGKRKEHRCQKQGPPTDHG